MKINVIRWLKDAWVFGPANYKEPLFKYVAYRLDEIENNISSSRKKFLLFTFAVLAILFLIVILKPFITPENVFWVDSPEHSILEAFCGLISIIIGLIIYWEYLASGKKNALFLVLGFFSMGILDIFHAFSDYCHNMFV